MVREKHPILSQPVQQVVTIDFADGEPFGADGDFVAFEEFDGFERNDKGFVDADEFGGGQLCFELGQRLFGHDPFLVAIDEDVIAIGFDVGDLVGEYFGELFVGFDHDEWLILGWGRSGGLVFANDLFGGLDESGKGEGF